MIAFIAGRLVEKYENTVVIDTGGIGYEVFVPTNAHIFLKAKGDEAVLQTAQIFKEDDVSLYGFEEKTALRMFKLLITVNGVGAKAAMAILSALTTDEAIRAIAFGDAAMLTRAQGIGKKSAERIVLELKDKVTELCAGGIPESAGGAAGSLRSDAGGAGGDIASESISVLMTLGIGRAEAANAVMNIQDEYETVEDCIRLALKSL